MEEYEVPTEVMDLVRFMCSVWSKVDEWAYANCSGDALAKYPVIQGTRNQMLLRSIANQNYDSKNVATAAIWMLTKPASAPSANPAPLPQAGGEKR